MNSTQLHQGKNHAVIQRVSLDHPYSDLEREPMMQMTLASPVRCSGVALHSGDVVTMVIRPAPASTGIVFYRSDVGGEQGMIPARYDLVRETTLGTTLCNAHGTTIATVEHLMAALWGAGIDNATIELDGPEVPIMDGSSEPFVFLIECAGVAPQMASRRLIEILRPVSVSEHGCSASLLPHGAAEHGATEGFILDITIRFSHASIGTQRAVYDFSDTNFKQALCRARTFGFVHEVEKMHAMGLALGGSLKNAIVVGEDGVVNDEGLRYPDEFVRHKALDVVGDYYLAGGYLIGRAVTERPGHGINNKLLRALFSDASNYRIIGNDSAV
jgi:UDP-3-O-[3-hydroxymyristoyl] N-acetylglucosamine deacetylase